MTQIGLDDSILSSVKSIMPNSTIPQDYTVFDTELMGYINAELAVISQLGIGDPEDVFMISGTGETWSDFLDNTEEINLVALYIAIRVKMMFDPPKSQIVMDKLTKQSEEYAFRIQDAARRHKKEA